MVHEELHDEMGFKVMPRLHTCRSEWGLGLGGDATANIGKREKSISRERD